MGKDGVKGSRRGSTGSSRLLLCGYVCGKGWGGGGGGVCRCE